MATFTQVRYDVFYWRAHTSIPWKITSAIVIAVATGLLAQVRFLLPFSPVPITGQTFAVLLAGVMLGRRWAGASMAFYAGLGLAGVPWLTGATSGLSATTGYLLGFVLAALFVGYVVDKKPNYRSFNKLLWVMLFASIVIINVPGLLWLGFWMNSVGDGSVTLVSVLVAGLIPFLPGAIIKATAAAGLSRVTTPRESYID